MRNLPILLLAIGCSSGNRKNSNNAVATETIAKPNIIIWEQFN